MYIYCMCVYIYVNTSDTVNLLSSKSHDGTIFIMGKANTVTKSTLYSMLQAVDTYLTTCVRHTLCNLHTTSFHTYCPEKLCLLHMHP